MQAAGLDHIIVANLPLRAQPLDLTVLFFGGKIRILAHLEELRLDAASEHDIGAAPGHIGGDRDDARTPRLRDDLRFARVLLRIQHVVRHLLLFQILRENFRILDRRRADQHRLAARVAVLDVGNDGIDLFLERAEDQVILVPADHRHVRRNHHRFEMVDLLKLERLGIRGARHAGELAVHAEIVLERDRCERLVLALDRHALFRFDRLVQAIGPAATGHQTSSEFVDDHHLAVLHDVLLIAVEQRVRAERRVQVMHETDVLRVVETRSRRDEPGLRKNRFGMLVSFFGQQDLMRFFIDPIIAGSFFFRLARELGRKLVQSVVQLDVVVRLSRNDERRTRLVDQDRIHFVDDRVVKATLDTLARGEHHVIAQIIEAELVVGAIRDIRGVGGLLVGVGKLGKIDADGQSEEFVDPAHPIGVALRQIIIDGDDVHAISRQRIEKCGQRRDERFSFAGAHFGDLAVVQRNAANELHVEMPHVQRALAGLADDGKSLRQNRIKRFAARDACLERCGFFAQRIVGKRADRGLERVDLRDRLTVLLQQSFVTAAENASEDV